MTRSRSSDRVTRPRRGTSTPPRSSTEPAVARGLDLLLGADRRRFLAEYWPARPFVHHGAIDRLDRLTGLQALGGAAQLLAARAAAYQDVTVHAGDGYAPKYMRSREALHFYQRGDLLGFSGAHETVPELREILAELALDLAEHPEDFQCSAFAACGEHGAFMHYDASLTFNLQLKGEKVWRIAANRHVENPLGTSDTRDHLAPGYAVRPLPKTMPADAMTFRVTPGSLVFIPRGYWHETDTFGESLAVTFSFVPPSWSQRVVHLLHRALEAHAGWREYPLGVASDPADRAALAREFGALLPQLREIAGSLTGALVLDAPLSEHCYRWPAGGSPPTVVRARGGGHALRVHSADGVLELAVDAELLPIVRWLCTQDAVWSLEQARAACPTAPAGWVTALLAELTAQGLIDAA